ncbi:uncharacterized protein B0P05DRAFT_520415 [Gilbertella persicaria]|uniref:uncharacterized protein n=1 Tax=Gilbertella persicaria TaxID=101096 RepID=UPI00221F6D57|nr:uncharacterized protein B0P05DRAFT_520415 [Gilbertella persicaria]KAI8046935.1 hypothetical protein B0P05DRAFT_520415 [Gilbertella persicaria]
MMASENIGNASNNNTLSVFMDHVKQVLSTIPPATKFALYAPFVIGITDNFLFPTLNVHWSTSAWFSLDYEQGLLKLQVFRFLLYPFATMSVLDAFITALWLIPEMYKLERKQGTLKFIWILMSVFTVLPGLLAVIINKALYTVWSQMFYNPSCHGMTGWVVGLIFWSYLSEDANEQDRMIAGAIRIPHQYWPALVFFFFVFLVPSSSIVLNILCAVAGYLCKYKHRHIYMCPFLLSDEKLVELEGKPILRFLTQTTNFVSVDSAGHAYLPIFNSTQEEPVSTPNAPFQGQGHRLGP